MISTFFTVKAIFKDVEAEISVRWNTIKIQIIINTFLRYRILFTLHNKNLQN